MNPSISPDSVTCLNYRDGMFLTSALMQSEQDYFSSMMALQNQLLYTPGVLSGLTVASDSSNAAALTVAPGVGLDESGHLLIFPGPQTQLSIPATCPNPFAVFAVFNCAIQNDLVNRAAVLVIGTTSTPPPNSAILATCGFNAAGVLLAPTDARIPVKSRLPVNLHAAPDADRLAADLDGALSGTIEVDVSDLTTTGANKPLQVYFRPGQNPGFNFIPAVHVTLQGPAAFAVTVNAVDTVQFQVTLTAFQALPASVTQMTLNWIAFKQ